MTASPYGGPSLVDLAEQCIRAFGGTISRPRAERLLRLWRHSRQLTPAERATVLARFRGGAR